MEVLDYPFMRSALLMGLILGILFPLMGVFVVTRGMSFFSDFIAHAAILGGALAVIAGISPPLFLIPYSIVVGLSASMVWNSFPLSRDTVLGVFYGGAIAAGVILIAVKGLSQTYLMQFLLGDILLISPLDIWLSAGLLAVFLVFLKLNLRKIVKSSFLPEVSMAEGVSVRAYDYVLIGFIAAAIALSVKVVGVILANAMVVIPAAAAKTISRNFRQFMFIAPLVGILSFVSGTVASFYLNIPTGPAIVAAAFVCFLAALAIKGVSA
ncbi:MAG: metal ABC transporter permease [Thermodesulfovibrionales bacterium]|nr:metal ABC transporter permease [Thermodesulfovibrionales bacterium]